MKKNMDINPHNREESKEVMREIVNKFKEDRSFEVKDPNPTRDNIDDEEIDKILDSWKQGEPQLLLVQYVVELDSGKKHENSIDKVKLLLWEQAQPKEISEEEVKIEPERNRYEGLVAKFRRVESKSGYYKEKFYLDEDQDFSDLKSHIRRGS